MNEFTFVVFLPGSPLNDWDHFHQKGKFLALAKKVEGRASILCVERPICPFVSTIRHPRKIQRWLKMKGHAHPARKNLYVYISIVLLHDLLAEKIQPISKANRWLKSFMIEKELSRLGLDQVPIITWLFHPYQIFDLDVVSSDLVIYDCYDAYSKFDGLSDRAINRIEYYEVQVLQRADVVFASAQELFMKKRETKDNTFFIPNAADDVFFRDRWPKKLPAPGDIECIPPPIIGFLGNLTNCIDWNLLDFLAFSRPQWSFVIIGSPVENLKNPLPKRKNIHYLGRKEYEDLPGYLSCFDLGIIPFVRTELTEAINPLKLYEYMAAGLPIVSTDIPEVQRFASIVSIARENQEFLCAVEALLQADNSCLIEKENELAQSHSWSVRATEIIRIIETKIDFLRKGLGCQ